MERAAEIWRGGVNPWDCDAMGHLNVRHHVARAGEGLVELAAQMGMPGAFTARAASTLTVREHHIRFLREARVGDALHMLGGVLEMSDEEAVLYQLLRHSDGRPSSAFHTRVAHVTPGADVAFPWPPRIREGGDALRVEVPHEARPRSLRPGPARLTGSLKRAGELGLRRMATGAVGPQDCDVFGRLRVEGVMARISEGATEFIAGVRRLMGDSEGGEDEARPRIGAAAVEFRLVYEAWPRAGERMVVHSGVAQASDRALTLIHWVLDPESGRPWAGAEHVVIMFDLEARKMTRLPEPVAARLREAVVEGLTL
jgi:acyl-CoA thioester hydrolase